MNVLVKEKERRVRNETQSIFFRLKKFLFNYITPGALEMPTFVSHKWPLWMNSAEQGHV